MFWIIVWEILVGLAFIFLGTGIWISLETQHYQSVPKEGGYE